MALQIRRGTTAERTARRFLEGELIYDVTLQQVFVGDSTDGATGTLGGKAVTAFTQEDAQDAIRDLFASGTHTNISFGYNDSGNSISAAVSLSSYTGNIGASGTITASGFNGWLNGNVFADDSTLLVDAGNGLIPAEVVQGTFTGSVVGNASSATVASTVTLTATATNTDHFITFVDTATGDENVRTDSDLKYNPSTNILTAGTFVGNVTGAVTGNIFTNSIDSTDSSAITFTPAVIFSSDLTVQNELYTANLNATDIANFTVTDPSGFNYQPDVINLTAFCNNTLTSGPAINFTVSSVADGTFNPGKIVAYRDTGDTGIMEVRTRDAGNGALSVAATFSSADGAIFPIGAGIQGTFSIDVGVAPTTSVGTADDFTGKVIIATPDAGTSWYVYYCVAEYDGVADIWTRTALDTTPW